MKILFNPKKLYDRDYITIEDLSETLNVSNNTIYRICYKGDLKKIKYMGRNYWKTDDVISYLEGKGIETERIKQIGIRLSDSSITNANTV